MNQSKKTKPAKPPRRPPAKPAGEDMNQATGAEFEREGLGIAPKE